MNIYQDFRLLWVRKNRCDEKEMALCDNLVYVGLSFMTLGMLTGKEIDT